MYSYQLPAPADSVLSPFCLSVIISWVTWKQRNW